jgi:hypothetical protein
MYYDIPDPFATFVAEKDAKKRGTKYDFFEQVWTHTCGACKEMLDAPSKKIMTKIRLYHTRNECLNGY